MALTFPPQHSPPRPRKRCRAAADVDGEHSSLHKKKRRLRLFLITSRLSPQYSHPATNIVDRGSSKIAVWAKQKAQGRNLLCKAAILNCIRRQAECARETRGGMGRVLVEQEKEQAQLHLAKMALVYGSHDTYTRPGVHRGSSSLPARASMRRDPYDLSDSSPSGSASSSPADSPSPPLRGRDPDNASEYCSPNDAYSYSPSRSRSPRRSYLPLPPSPLSLSNYDAFDADDESLDPYAHLEDDYDDTTHHDDIQAANPFLSSVGLDARPSVIRRQSGEPFTTSPPPVYTDSSMLNPDEPVVGDYDQVDEGANAIWPINADLQDLDIALPMSSPDFPALFAPTSTASTSLSPNFASPNFTPDFISPPLVPVLGPMLGSSLAALPTIVGEIRTVRADRASRVHRPEVTTRKDNQELEDEKERQKKYMFMQFGSYES